MNQGQYLINEIYYTIHGEGKRYGIPHVFIRFSQCNLECGFCDTEYESGRIMTGQQILEEAEQLTKVADHQDVTVNGAKKHGRYLPQIPCRNILFCGGEPLLQIDSDLITLLKTQDPPWFLAIETNGTRAVPAEIDWVTMSPKVAEHAIVPTKVNEVKYVRGYGHGIPKPIVQADHYLLSPMFDGEMADPKAIEWCVKLVKENPQWSLTVQHHKLHFGQLR